jgi:hypothetical protein
MARQLRLKVGAADLGSALEIIMRKYADEIGESVDDVTNEMAFGVSQEISETSPRRDGGYAGAWTYEEADEANGHVARVYNQNKPSLTHLLEYGHAKRGGKGRVPGIPHIAPAANRAGDEYPKRLAAAIRRAGT